MKIKRFYMEDWLIECSDIQFNLAESGTQDFYLKDFLALCNVDSQSFESVFLGNNDTKGSVRLREEICQSYTGLPIEEVMVTNGSSEAIFCFLNELLDEDDEVVIPFPTFQCLYQIPISIGCNVKFLQLLECAHWKLDLDKLDTLVTPNTKLIIINTPHNPFGWILSEEELTRIGEIAKKHACYLLFDEHYRYLPLTAGTELLPSGYDICKTIHDKTYATGSMIKCFGIVGIRIGWLLGEPEFMARCRDYKDYLTHTIPEVTDYIAYLSLKNKETLIALKKKHILRNLELLNQFMANNSDIFEYSEPAGGVVCFPKLKNGIDSREFCEILQNQYAVALLPGFAFETEGHFRLNFGVNSEKFKMALERMQRFIDSCEFRELNRG